MVESIHLRPHHLLCHRLFAGKGYNPSFAENLRDVITRMESEDAVVVLSPSCDDICLACPHNLGGSCTFAVSVRAKDAAASAFFELPQESTIPTRELARLLDNKMVALSSVVSVCGQCEWSEDCDKQLAMRRRSR